MDHSSRSVSRQHSAIGPSRHSERSTSRHSERSTSSHSASEKVVEERAASAVASNNYDEEDYESVDSDSDNGSTH